MDQPSREQVRRILDDLLIISRKAVDNRIKRIYARNAANGLLKSGGTIKGIVGAVEEIAADFIKRAVDDVVPVAKDMEAFAMIQEAAEGLLRIIAAKVGDAAELASGSDQRTMEAAKELYRSSESGLRRQLEIHRFTFTVPQKPSQPVSTPTPVVANNRGGKPLAAHWDEMWAATAVMLYIGDLKPETQADIERAMKDWLATNGVDVGDTAVRERARKLWQKLRSAE